MKTVVCADIRNNFTSGIFQGGAALFGFFGFDRF